MLRMRMLQKEQIWLHSNFEVQPKANYENSESEFIVLETVITTLNTIKCTW